MKVMLYRERTHHAKSSAQTGKPHPNMSTIFMGRSKADELEWRHIPRSAEPENFQDQNNKHKTVPQKPKEQT